MHVNTKIYKFVSNVDLIGLILKIIDCEAKSNGGNVCVATFDWSCSGICESVERMKEVHKLCGEDNGAIWNVAV